MKMPAFKSFTTSPQPRRNQTAQKRPADLVAATSVAPVTQPGTSSTLQTAPVRRPAHSGVAWCLLALAALALAYGEGLAGVIFGMFSLLRWLWVTRPIPNPYESRPYDPNDPADGF
jgi:hypothetical protein